MKKLIFVLISVLIIVGLSGIVVPDFSTTTPAKAEPEARGETRTVLAEQFTATWCGFCPNAAGGLKQLQDEVGIENFVVLAYHLSDNMATAETDARATAYGVSGIPDVWFDASLRQTGAGSVSDAYNAYKAHYNTRRGSQSPITIASGGVIDGSTATVYAQLEKVDSVSGSLNIRYVLYENGVNDGGTSYKNVVRKMEVDSVSSTDFPMSKEKSFTIQSGWNSANLNAAIFVQVGTNGEVLQAKYEDFDGPLNEAPTVSNPTYTTHSINEDVEDSTLNLNTIFSDPESDPLTFDSDATTASNVQVTIETNGVAKLLSKLNWNGQQDIEFTATDGPFHDPISHKITVTVTAVNDAPVPTTENLDFKMVEDSYNNNINLNDVFSEVDDGDTMVFSVTGNVNLAVDIASDGTVTIDSTGEFQGAEKITFIATDVAGATGTKDVIVTVTGQNDMPIVQGDGIEDFSINEDEEDASIDLNQVFLDSDGDTLFFSYEKNKNIGVAIDGDGIVTLTPRKDWNGDETITFKATDKLSPNVKEDVTITVLPVNDAPVPKEFDKSGLKIDEDVESTIFFEATDIENDQLTFETNIRSKVKGLEKGKNYFFDESTGEMIITPTNDMVGEYTVQMKVTDDGSPPKESDPVEFTLYILNKNDIPKNVQIIEPMPGSVFKEGDTINFLGSAEDDDLLIPENEEVLMFQWRSNNMLGPIGTTEQFSFSNLEAGEHVITLTVMDSMNDASSATVTITIQAEGGADDTSKTGSPDDKGADSSMSNLWWILAALVVVIVVVLVIMMMFMRKKKPELTPEEMQLQSYYDRLQDQGMLTPQTPAYGYGYQQPGMMGTTGFGQPYPQQTMYQQQTVTPPSQLPMQPPVPEQPKPQVSVAVAQAPAPAKVVGIIEPKVAEKPQLPPAKEELANLPKTKPVTMNTQSKPKDWNWNY
jgi:thiol-disulfide isomerase/thioredoxin